MPSVPITGADDSTHNIETQVVAGLERQVIVALVTSLLGATLGQAPKSGSVPVAFASDQNFPNLNVSQVGAWVNSISQLPAANPLTDGIVYFPGLGFAYVWNGAGFTACTIKYKSVTVSSGGTDVSVIAAVTAKRLVVLEAHAQVGGTATTLTFESDDPSADTRVWKVPAGINGGAVRYSPHGLFETDAGEGLICTATAGSDAEVNLAYVEAP